MYVNLAEHLLFEGHLNPQTFPPRLFNHGVKKSGLKKSRLKCLLTLRFVPVLFGKKITKKQEFRKVKTLQTITVKITISTTIIITIHIRIIIIIFNTNCGQKMSHCRLGFLAEFPAGQYLETLEVPGPKSPGTKEVQESGDFFLSNSGIGRKGVYNFGYGF